MEAYDILVITLASALGIFLILGIVFMVFLVRIIRTLDAVSQKAQAVVDNVETASRIVSSSAGKIAFTKFAANAFEMFRESQQGKKSKKGKK